MVHISMMGNTLLSNAIDQASGIEVCSLLLGMTFSISLWLILDGL